MQQYNFQCAMVREGDLGMVREYQNHDFQRNKDQVPINIDDDQQQQQYNTDMMREYLFKKIEKSNVHYFYKIPNLSKTSA